MRDKEIMILVIVMAAAVFGALVWRAVSSPPAQRACTMEAKICPDGSAVGRTGPNCEFAACP